MNHDDHLVQWKRNGREHVLYCFTCGGFTRLTTTTPNSAAMQRYEQATVKPEEIAITLEVQSTRHRQNMEVRNG